MVGDDVQVHAADADGNLVAGDLRALVDDGVLTLSGTAEDRAVIDTLAEWLDVALLVFEANERGVAATGDDFVDVLAFEFEGDTYVVSAIDDENVDQVMAIDNVVKLTGVTGITDVDTVAAANTILIA